jgi:hypothetical protein
MGDDVQEDVHPRREPIMASTESVLPSSNKGRFIVIAALFGALAAGGVHTTASSLGSSAAPVPKTATPIRGVVVTKPSVPTTTKPPAQTCVGDRSDGGARRNCPVPK